MRGKGRLACMRFHGLRCFRWGAWVASGGVSADAPMVEPLCRVGEPMPGLTGVMELGGFVRQSRCRAQAPHREAGPLGRHGGVHGIRCGSGEWNAAWGRAPDGLHRWCQPARGARLFGRRSMWLL